MRKLTVTKIKVLVFTTLLVILDILLKTIFEGKTYFQNSFVYIHSTQNHGSAFSLLSNFPYYSMLIFILSVILVTLILFYYEKFPPSRYLDIVITLAASGIIANASDRLVFGYVRDYIAVKDLFVFNLADSYLFFAVVIYILYEISLQDYWKKKNNSKLTKDKR